MCTGTIEVLDTTTADPQSPYGTVKDSMKAVVSVSSPHPRSFCVEFAGVIESIPLKTAYLRLTTIIYHLLYCNDVLVCVGITYVYIDDRKIVLLE